MEHKTLLVGFEKGDITDLLVSTFWCVEFKYYSKLFDRNTNNKGE